MEVYKAINEVHKELAKVGIAKNDINSFDSYKFRGIDAVYNTVSPILAKHGLMILQRVLSCNTTERNSKNGGVLFFSVVDVEFDLVAIDGSKHTIKTYGEGMDRSDKSINKALTAAYKYALFQCFCIPVEGSPDADLESLQVESKTEVDMKLIERSASSIIDYIHGDFTESERDGGVREVFGELDDNEKSAIWKAKTKGGFFDQKEKALIQKIMCEVRK